MLRYAIGAGLIIGLSVTHLLELYLLVTAGGFTAIEMSMPTLVFEVVLFIAAFMFGWYLLFTIKPTRRVN